VHVELGRGACCRFRSVRGAGAPADYGGDSSRECLPVRKG
jgi:hypothetical protein